MKTIDEGIVPDPDDWWIGFTVRCDRCGFSGELEEGDDVSTWMPGWCRSASITCPTCGGSASYTSERFTESQKVHARSTALAAREAQQREKADEKDGVSNTLTARLLRRLLGEDKSA